MNLRSAFTLIELLVVIAVIAILSVVIVLVLNPAELLRQSRDATRVSDMASLNTAIGLFSADQSNGTLGSANTIYVSIPDPIATSTLGDQCQGLGLPVPPSSYNYFCAASSTFRKVDGTGWIPINFNQASFRSPLASLPIDPINASSSRNYYTYETNGSQYEVTSPMESNKYKLAGANDIVSTDGGTLASVYEKGTKLGLEPLDYGDGSLVGYWTFDEGTGTVAYDSSGSNATGTLTNGPTWVAGKVGSGALSFNGSNNYVNAGNPATLNITSNITIAAWVNETDCAHHEIIDKWGSGGYLFNMFSGCVPSLYATGGTFSKANTWITATSSIVTGTWYQVAVTYDGSNVAFYINGVPAGSTAATGAWNTSNATLGIGQNRAANWFSGLIDDVRIYNRTLSASEISAMYNGGK